MLNWSYVMTQSMLPRATVPEAVYSATTPTPPALAESIDTLVPTNDLVHYCTVCNAVLILAPSSVVAPALKQGGRGINQLHAHPTY